MDLDTFLASATALEPCFHVYASAGTRWDGRVPADLAHALRELGIEAERAMFSATHGINTHKGANFAFALILGSCGAFLSENGSLPSGPRDTERVLELVRSMGACLIPTSASCSRGRSGTSVQTILHPPSGTGRTAAPHKKAPFLMVSASTCATAFREPAARRHKGTRCWNTSCFPTCAANALRHARGAAPSATSPIPC